LPKWYRDEYARTSMLIYPIVIKNVPMGLLYMDSLTPVSPADDNRYRLIKTLRNQIVLAIRQSSSK
ncbi:MAG: hypothetical protein QG652_1285, partial [Pseudomonadota bacterium]|nr:hypothetical protein [Pseudomonadota bacterium]